MKDIKEKPTERVPRSNTRGNIPKAALKKAWAEAKEKSRTKLRESISAQGDGDYTTANDTGGMLADTSYSAIKKNTDFTAQQGRKFARKQMKSTENAALQSRSQLPTPQVSAVSARNKPSAERCPMRCNARVVGQN